jgi:FAD/FMN-containing dehydrogenase
MVTASLPEFLRAAEKVVGAAHVLTDPADTAGYVTDWTRRWVGTTPAVLRPGDAGEVAELVALARTHRVALVPQGGNTGLVGGSVPLAGEVVLGLGRLATIEPVDRLAGQVTVGAGVTLGTLQAAAAEAGWAFGVDLAARDSATLGGMIGTNAGGLNVVRHGALRAQVIGVEAVLGTGALVQRLSGLVKDNTGYDLAQLLCGSEGTLGIVTRARLRLVPPPGPVAVALLGLPSMTAAVALAAALRVRLTGVRALEAMTGDSLRRVARFLDVAVPASPDAAAYLLVEAESPTPTEDPALVLAEALHDAAAAGAADTTDGADGADGLADAVEEAAVATATGERERLWRLREAQPEAAAALGVVHKLDVTLPTAELAGFCDDVGAEIARRWPAATTFLYGHVGDGNVHVNVVGGPESDEIDDSVLEQVVRRGGSISAEHGIGTAKKRWLTRDRSAAEIDAMRSIKHALDPDGILNPNVLLPGAG